MTTQMILDTLKDYANPKMKLNRLVKEGKYIRLVRGLYETESHFSPYSLVHVLCSPSYVSFERALCEYDLIPEYVPAMCCATLNKGKNKYYETPFTRYLYEDIPARAFYLEIEETHDMGVTYWRATREKAVCDKLYKLPIAKNKEDFEHLMFDDMRFDEDGIAELNIGKVKMLAEAFRCKNIDYLCKYLS